MGQPRRSVLRRVQLCARDAGYKHQREQPERGERYDGAIPALDQYSARTGDMCGRWRVGVVPLGHFGECTGVLDVYGWVYGVFGAVCCDVSANFSRYSSTCVDLLSSPR